MLYLKGFFKILGVRRLSISSRHWTTKAIWMCDYQKFVLLCFRASYANILILYPPLLSFRTTILSLLMVYNNNCVALNAITILQTKKKGNDSVNSTCNSASIVAFQHLACGHVAMMPYCVFIQLSSDWLITVANYLTVWNSNLLGKAKFLSSQ